MLNTQIYGSPTEQPPLLIVHGLFGSARNWGVIARRLSTDREVIAVDQRNHGDSPWTETHSYADMAADLARVIEAHGGRADVLGHSMGGKAAMVLALARPDLVRRLVVADMAPVAYDHGHSHASFIGAMQRMDLSNLTLRSEADRRLARDIDSEQVRAFLLQSLDLKADPPRWKLNLDVLDAHLGDVLDWPAPPGRFTGPALFVYGMQSDYVAPEYRPAIFQKFPNAEFHPIEGAGHWLHAERPREFEAAVADFIA